MSDLRSRIEALEQKHSGVARPALVLVEGRGGFLLIERHDMSLRAPPEN